MSMGYGANYADVIEEKEVVKLCPAEFESFVKACQKADPKSTFTSYESYAQASDFDDDEWDDVDIAFGKLQAKFNEITGLKLYIGYHNSDEAGSCHDSVDGAYFSVDGVYELTEAGKKYEKIIAREFFVYFG
jgi:hypothetical protein